MGHWCLMAFFSIRFGNGNMAEIADLFTSVWRTQIVHMGYSKQIGMEGLDWEEAVAFRKVVSTFDIPVKKQYRLPTLHHDGRGRATLADPSIIQSESKERPYHPQTLQLMVSGVA